MLRSVKFGIDLSLQVLCQVDCIFRDQDCSERLYTLSVQLLPVPAAYRVDLAAVCASIHAVNQARAKKSSIDVMM